ncbi:MAG: hypothetical protein J6O50_08135 [Ruminiclostridium sp.]|nr:hypothetical protein [Ruminiclostridium sp.]
MARIECKCGQIIWNGETPNDIEFWAYSDRTMDSILMSDSVSSPDFSANADYNVWLCPLCRRLYIFKGKDNVPLYVYTPEEN